MGKVIAFILEKMLYASAIPIALAKDNLTAHSKAALYEVFALERARNILKRISFVHTSKHGSCLNMSEIELNVLNRVALKQRIINKTQLEKQIKAYLKKTKQLYKSIGSSQQKMPEHDSKNYTPNSNL